MEKGPFARPCHAPEDAVPGSLCPDPEVLAALIDHDLGPVEREHVAAHLAGCDKCGVLLAHVVEIQHAVGHVAPAGTGTALVATPAGRRSLSAVMRWGMGSALAAAAALLFFVQVQPRWWSGQADSADSRLADLAHAVGEEWTVEGRLTGGFRHGPVRAPARSGGSSVPMDNRTLYAAAGKVREHAERDPSAANLHALGIAQLVVGDYDAAVLAIENAVAADASRASFQSDLAVAYLTRAKQLQRPEDLPRALGAAERALRADQDLLEARFNHALILESMFLEDQARHAWEDYVARDRSSAWTEEARRHLTSLNAKLGPSNQSRCLPWPPSAL